MKFNGWHRQLVVCVPEAQEVQNSTSNKTGLVTTPLIMLKVEQDHHHER